MSELVKQLRQLQQTSRTEGGTPFSSKLKPSLLFTEQEAADLDAQSILALGKHGLGQLQAMDSAFLAYEASLFASNTADRSLLSADENAELDQTIHSFIRLLGPHFLLPATAKCLEWLIRGHRVNELNVDYLLATFLPFHEHPQFIRLVQLCYFTDNSTWGFLFPVKQDAKTVNRSYLVGRCFADPSLLDRIWQVAQAQADRQSTVYPSFFTLLMVELMDRVFANAAQPDIPRLSQAMAICQASLVHPVLVTGGLIMMMELARLVPITNLADLLALAERHADPTQYASCLNLLTETGKLDRRQ